MKKATIYNYVMTIPGGEEFFFTVENNGETAIVDAATRVLHRTSLRRPYGCQDTVEVEISRLMIVNDKQVKTSKRIVQIDPLSLPMTEHQYAELEREALSGLPKSLASWVSSQAYQRGHQSGMSACLEIVQDLAYDLRKLLPTLKQELDGVAVSEVQDGD